MAETMDDTPPDPPKPKPPPDPVVLAKPIKKVWTEQQLAIINEFRDKKGGNVVIIARAGSSKTTVSIEGGKWSPEHKVIYAAFGNGIAAELKDRLPDHRCRAMTIHSMGCMLIGEHRKFAIDNNIKWIRADTAIAKWVHENSWDKEAAEYLKSESWLVVKLVELVKQMAPYSDLPEEVISVADDMSLANVPPTRLTSSTDFWPHREIPDLIHVVAQVVCDVLYTQTAEALIVSATEPLVIDFCDMIWIPVRCAWMIKRWPLMVVDEAQDLCFTQLEICLGMCRGRMIVVGDDMQAIYGWRGADSGALERMIKILGAKVMHLTISFRCPRAVVKEANKYVEDFHAWDNAKEGSVEHIHYADMLGSVVQGDFVLSRKNAPLMGICLKLIASGKRAMMAGNDVGLKMLKLLEGLERDRNFTDCHDMWNRLKSWASEQKEKIRESVEKKFSRAKPDRQQKEMMNRWELVLDELGMLSHMIKEIGCPKKIKWQLKHLFERSEDNCNGRKIDRTKYIFCSSVHGAKGLEAKNVYVLADTLRPERDQEEKNIAYVAITRSQENLYMCWAKDDDLFKATSGETPKLNEDWDSQEEWKKQKRDAGAESEVAKSRKQIALEQKIKEERRAGFFR